MTRAHLASLYIQPRAGDASFATGNIYGFGRQSNRSVDVVDVADVV